MTQELITYIFVGVLAFFVVLSFAVGLEKMIKIILGNYVLGIVCLSTSAAIDLAINNSTSQGFVNFMSNGKIFIVLLVYVLLFILIYHKSMISINIPSDKIMQKSLYIFFVPLTVFSMFLILEVILLGTNLFDSQFLMDTVKGFTNNVYLQQFIANTPYWMLVHAVSTILFTSEFKTKIITDVTDM